MRTYLNLLDLLTLNESVCDGRNIARWHLYREIMGSKSWAWSR